MSRDATLRAVRRRRRRTLGAATATLLVAGSINVASVASAQQEEAPTETTAPPPPPDDPHGSASTIGVDTTGSDTLGSESATSNTTTPDPVLPETTTASTEPSTEHADITEPSTTVAEVAVPPSVLDVPSMAAFSAPMPGGRTVEVGDPLSLNPWSVDLGVVPLGASVAETIRVVNDSPDFREILVYGFDDVVVSGVDPSCGTLRPPDAAYPVAAAIAVDSGASCDIVITLDDTTTERSINAELWFENVESNETDQLVVTAQVLAPEPPVDAVAPVISISGPLQATVGSTATVTVTARHPGGTALPVSAGFQFNLAGDFVERVVSAVPNSSGVACVARPGESPAREFSCVSSVGLGVGESVDVTFEVSTPANAALSPCLTLTPDGQRFGPYDFAGPVCLNVVAYPGPYDDVPINRAIVGGDAAMVSIPLIGPYLRFTASATDAPPGEPVTLTVTPRNPGTDPLTDVRFVVFQEPRAPWNGVSPSGWSCSAAAFGSLGEVGCTASTLTLGAGQSADPIQLTFTAPATPNPSSCPISVLPIAGSQPDPCGTFVLAWNSQTSSTAVSRVAYRIGDAGPVITITGVAPGQTITTFSPTLTVSADKPLFNAICTLETPLPGGGSDVNEIGCLADGLLSADLGLPDLPDGQITFTVSAADAAGNRREVSVTFFVEAPPTANISAPADGASYAPAEVPASVSYQCVDNGEIVVEEVQLVPQDGGSPALLTGPPPSSVGTHTVRVICVDGIGEEAIASATYSVEVDGSGPCVLVDTPTVDFGEVTVGSTSPDRSVVVRSCSTAPISVAASVSDATTVGGVETWLATTSTVPAAAQFSWSITPDGGSSPVPVSSAPTSIGPVLAPGASRSDAHRLRLGPAGPGLGIQFASTITYTATIP